MPYLLAFTFLKRLQVFLNLDPIFRPMSPNLVLELHIPLIVSLISASAQEPEIPNENIAAVAAIFTPFGANVLPRWTRRVSMRTALRLFVLRGS